MMRRSASADDIDDATAEVIRKLVDEEKRRMPSRRTKQKVDYKCEYISVGVDDKSATTSQATSINCEEWAKLEQQFSREPQERCSSVPLPKRNLVQTQVKDEGNNANKKNSFRDSASYKRNFLPFVKLEKIDQNSSHKQRICNSQPKPSAIKTEKVNNDDNVQCSKSSGIMSGTLSTDSLVKREPIEKDEHDKSNTTSPNLNSLSEKCPNCDALFPSKKYLHSHLNFCPKKSHSFQCEVCGKEFSRENVLKIHLLIHGKKTTKKNIPFLIKREPDGGMQSDTCSKADCNSQSQLNAEKHPDPINSIQEQTLNIHRSLLGKEKQSDVSRSEAVTKNNEKSPFKAEIQCDIQNADQKNSQCTSMGNSEQQTDASCLEPTEDMTCDLDNIANSGGSVEKPKEFDSIEDDVVVMESMNHEAIPEVISIDDDDDLEGDDNASNSSEGKIPHSILSNDKSDRTTINFRSCGQEDKQHHEDGFGYKNRRRRHRKKLLFNKPKQHQKQKNKIQGSDNGQLLAMVNAKQRTCSECLRPFKSRGSLLHHMRMYHGYKHSEIRHSRKPPKMKLHIQSSDDVNCCPCCFSVFSARHHLIQHLRACFKKKRSYRVSNKGNVSVVNSDGNNSRHGQYIGDKTCPLCHMVFDEWKEILVHLKNCYDRQWPYQCNVCNMSYKNERPLKIHKVFHHDGAFAKCSICNKGFSSSFDLNEHLFELHPESIEQSLISGEYDKKKAVCGVKKNRLDLDEIEDYPIKKKRKTANHLDGVSRSLVKNASIDTEYGKNTFERDFETVSNQPEFSSRKSQKCSKEAFCTLCYEKLPSKAHLGQHILVRHAETLDVVSNPYSVLTVADISRNNQKRFESVYKNYTYKDGKFNYCPRCYERFYRLSDYFDHNCKFVSSSQECFICLASYEDTASVVEHLNTHRSRSKSPNKPKNIAEPQSNYFNCRFCEYSTQTIVDLSKHMMLIHSMFLDEISAPRPDVPSPSPTSQPPDTERDLVDRYCWQYHCNVCYERCKSDSFISAHKKHTGVPKTYSCLHCKSAIFRNHNEYVNHLGGHRHPYTCTICKKIFTTGSELVRHRYSNHELQKMCSKCHERLPDLTSLRKHWCSHFDENHEELVDCDLIKEQNFKFKCDKCYAKFPSQALLFSHFKTCHIECSHTCKFCQQRFDSPVNKGPTIEQKLLGTRLGYRPGRHIQCPFCTKNFSMKYILIKHMIDSHLDEYQRKSLSSSLHIPDDHLKCTLCDWKFLSLQEWVDHTKNHKIIDIETLKKQQVAYVLSLLMKDHSYPKNFHMRRSGSDTDDSSETEMENKRFSDDSKWGEKVNNDDKHRRSLSFDDDGRKDQPKTVCDNESRHNGRVVHESPLEISTTSGFDLNCLEENAGEVALTPVDNTINDTPDSSALYIEEPVSTECFMVRLQDSTLSECVVTTCTGIDVDEYNAEGDEHFSDRMDTEVVTSNFDLSGGNIQGANENMASVGNKYNMPTEMQTSTFEAASIVSAASEVSSFSASETERASMDRENCVFAETFSQQADSEIKITEVTGGVQRANFPETSVLGQNEYALDLQEAIKIHAMSWKVDEHKQTSSKTSQLSSIIIHEESNNNNNPLQSDPTIETTDLMVMSFKNAGDYYGGLTSIDGNLR